MTFAVQLSLLVFVCMTIVKFEGTDALMCSICNHSFCPKPTNCKGGLTMGVCRCCEICAQTEGEICGGFWNFYGKCDQGLKCEVTRKKFHGLPGVCGKI